MKDHYRLQVSVEAELLAVRDGRDGRYFVRINAPAKGERCGVESEQSVIRAPVSETVYRALYDELSSDDACRHPALRVSGYLEMDVRPARLFPPS